MLVLANQSEGVLDRFALTREEVDRSVWAIDVAGGRWEGAAAINRILAQLGGGWPVFARLASLPPLLAIEAQLYRLTVRNRHRLAAFGVPPEWEEPVSPRL